MKKISFVLALVMCLGALSGCGHKMPSDGYFLTSDLDGARVGIVEGITTESQVAAEIDNAKIKKFQTTDEAIDALRKNKIHALVLDGFSAKNVTDENDDLGEMIQKIVDKKYYAATFIHDKSKGDNFLLEIDGAITKLGHTGLDDTLYSKYFTKDLPDSSELVYNTGKVEGRTLIVGVAEDNAPFSYLDKDGRYIGFDVEVANEIAKTWGATLEIRAYPREKLLAAAESGEVNVVFGRLTDVDDKAENDWMLFSMPYYDASQVVVLNKDTVGVSPIK